MNKRVLSAYGTTLNCSGHGRVFNDSPQKAHDLYRRERHDHSVGAQENDRRYSEGAAAQPEPLQPGEHDHGEREDPAGLRPVVHHGQGAEPGHRGAGHQG